MKIKFKDYTYIDPTSQDNGVYDYTDPNVRDKIKDYVYDENYYQELMSKNRHVDAYNYRKHYHNNDPYKDREDRIKLAKYGQVARLHEAIYNKAVKSGKYDVDALQLAESWRNSGNFNDIEDNEQIDKLRKLKSLLGSDVGSDNSFFRNTINGVLQQNPITGAISYASDVIPKHNLKDVDYTLQGKEASRIKLSFEPAQRKIFKKVNSTFWSGDWLLRDNPNTLDAALNRLNVSKEVLEKSGVVFSRDSNGYDSIEFDKSNDFATLLMVNAIAGDFGTFKKKKLFQYAPVYLTSYDSEGNIIKENSNLVDFGDDNRPRGNDSDSRILTAMQNIIRDAENITNNYFSSQQNRTFDITSYDTAPIEDMGTGKEYKKYALDEIFGNGVTVNYDIYSNTGVIDDKTRTDTKLRLVEDQQMRTNLMQLMAGQDYNNLILKIKSVDGVEGAHIILRPKVEAKSDKDTKGSNYEDLLMSDMIEVWIPGFIPGQGSDNVLYGDTHINSMREVNHMTMFDYDYTTNNGETIIPDGNNGFILDDGTNQTQITKEDAIRRVTKDQIVNDSEDFLYNKFVNNNNELFDEDGFRNLAKQLAVRAANETYANIDILNKNGEPMSVDEIFSMKGEDDVAEPYKSLMQWEEYRKIIDIYDIYRQLTKNLSLYRK